MFSSLIDLYIENYFNALSESDRHHCKVTVKYYLKIFLLLLQIRMIPGSNIFGHERALVLRVSFATCIVGTVCLPLFGLVTCVFISSAFHFDDSTGTHCQVLSFVFIL